MDTPKKSLGWVLAGIVAVASMLPSAVDATTKTKKPVALPTPTDVTVYWHLRFSNGTGVGRDRCCGISKKLFWQIEADPHVVAYDVYEQAPDESAYHLLRTVELSLLNGQSSYFNTVDVDAWTGHQLQLYQDATTHKVTVAMFDWKHKSLWPAGVYKHYIVPRDAQGTVGPKSVVVAGTYVGDGRVIKPAEGQAVVHDIQTGAFPVLEWADPMKDVKLTSKKLSTRCSYVAVWGGTGGPLPLWNRYLCSGETATLYDNSASELQSGQPYSVVATVLVTDKPNANACPCFSVSEPVGFTAQ